MGGMLQTIAALLIANLITVAFVSGLFLVVRHNENSDHATLGAALMIIPLILSAAGAYVYW